MIARIVRCLEYAGLVLLCSVAPVHAQTDGIFAVFNTSMGSFTCFLDHVRAPRTVANFIALTEGSNAWLNLNTGQEMHTRFYDGTIFHRVVSNFVIQGGGQRVGSSFLGPGYAFRDEFSPDLRHNSNGILAMANSGPNSQGSQFYITCTPSYSSGDDRYTIFGHVSAGTDVVQAINWLPLTNSRPIVDVVLSNVTILRIGSDAEAFDCMAWGLPVVAGTKAGLMKTGSNVNVTYSRFTNSVNTVFYSTNLSTWSSIQVVFQTNAVQTNALDVTSMVTNVPMQFFNVSQVAYPDPVYTPSTVVGQSFHMLFSSSGTRLSHWLGQNGTGTWNSLTADGYYTNGNIISYTWAQNAYFGQMYVVFDAMWPRQYTCTYDVPAPATNRFSQIVYVVGVPQNPTYGTYTNGP